LAYGGYKRAEAQYHFTEKVIQTQSQNDYVKNLTLAFAKLLARAAWSLRRLPDAGTVGSDCQTVHHTNLCHRRWVAMPANATACDTLPNVFSALLSKSKKLAAWLCGCRSNEMDGKSKAPKLLGANAIGAVGGIPVPEVTRYIAGYKYCAKKVDPSVRSISTTHRTSLITESAKMQLWPRLTSIKQILYSRLLAVVV